MTRDDARLYLMELDDLSARLAVVERRLGPDDPEVRDLQQCVQIRRAAVFEFLDALAAVEAAGIEEAKRQGCQPATQKES